VNKAIQLLEIWDTDASCEDQIMRVLKFAGRPLSHHSIMAVAAFVHDAAIGLAIVTLLLDGEVTAEYIGSPDDHMADLDKYLISVAKP
jgi:hypothetical protein